MKNAAPRIFRSLETQTGAEAFDTIVSAAVAAYGSLRAPSETQARDFGKLVVPAWDKISADTRRTLAAALSHSPRVPRAVVEKLITAPVEISAPFLVASPVLTDTDLASLAASGDERIRRILSGRNSADASLQAFRDKTARDNAAAARTETMLPSRKQTVSASPAPVPVPPQPAHQMRSAPKPVIAAPPIAEERLTSNGAGIMEKTAAAAREALLRLARPGRRPAPASASASAASFGEVLSIRELIGLATDGLQDAFYEALAASLTLAPEQLTTIRSDATGERLATALKALNASSADTMTILMMMVPSIGLDVRAFATMKDVYDALEVADCRRALGLSVKQPVKRAPSLQPLSVDIEGLQRPAARPQFGRRKTAPAESSKVSGRG
ncbi:hypothetical protein [Mangrovicella endophytica]|uniref:hypothetical protein n=1 Tax=Mangrovicella endophytica TaxID=2066697 RepID=UPI000C9E6194|nr:hypothetical protein [Mangrovicella endophytica]